MAEVSNYVYINRSELKGKELDALRASLTFSPDGEKVVECYRYNASTGLLTLPRGVLGQLPSRFHTDKGLMRDKRSFPKLPRLDHDIDLDYQGVDKKFFGQREAVEAMKANQNGVILRNPGTGKTQLALAAIAEFGTRTLVIVHTDDLMAQWIKYAKNAIPGIEIGIIKGQKETIGHITIAMIQTLSKNFYPVEWWRQFGMTIVDEMHHVASRTNEYVINQTTSRYRFGLTASETRADRMHPLNYMLIGPIIHKQEFKSPIPVTVKKIETDFRHGFNPGGQEWQRRKQWASLTNSLIADKRRNIQIAQEVDAQINEGRKVLLLSRRIEHLLNIAQEMEHKPYILAASGPHRTHKNEREGVIQDFRDGKIDCILSTQIFDEGVDVAILSTVVLAFPGRHRDKIIQQVGRALREHPEKTDAVVIDVVDNSCKVLRNQWLDRKESYKKWGFKIAGQNGGLTSRFKIDLNSSKGKRKVLFGRRS